MAELGRDVGPARAAGRAKRASAGRPEEKESPRRAAIVESAIGVFTRYGFKKTSMDDLARAAGISRQGLYLHYPTKEALFRAVVLEVVGAMRAGAEVALADESRDVEARLLATFEAIHGALVGKPHGEHVDELIDAADALLGPVVPELEDHVLSGIAAVLKKSGVAARWRDAGLTAKDLAAHLDLASKGAKHSSADAAAYRAKLETAIRLVCRGRA